MEEAKNFAEIKRGVYDEQAPSIEEIKKWAKQYNLI